MRTSIRLRLVLSLVATLVVACTQEPPEEVAFVKGDAPDEVFTDFVTQESDSGLVQWKLTAPRANRFSKKKLVLLEKPLIEFYNRDGSLQTTLVSENGEYSEETRDMLAFGNVVVTSVDGDVLETDSLLWNNEADKIQSNCFVKLIRGSDIVTGIGLECDPNLTSVDIKRNVQATIREGEGNSID